MRNQEQGLFPHIGNTYSVHLNVRKTINTYRPRVPKRESIIYNIFKWRENRVTNTGARVADGGTAVKRTSAFRASCSGCENVIKLEHRPSGWRVLLPKVAGKDGSRNKLSKFQRAENEKMSRWERPRCRPPPPPRPRGPGGHKSKSSQTRVEHSHSRAEEKRRMDIRALPKFPF